MNENLFYMQNIFQLPTLVFLQKTHIRTFVHSIHLFWALSYSTRSFAWIFRSHSAHCALYIVKEATRKFTIIYRLRSQKHVSLLGEHGLECFLKPPKSIIASFLQPTPTFPIGISRYTVASFFFSSFLLKKS